MLSPAHRHRGNYCRNLISLMVNDAVSCTHVVHHSIISLFYVFVWLLVEKETVKVFFFFLGKFFGASFVISLNEVDTDCRYLIDIQFAR